MRVPHICIALAAIFASSLTSTSLAQSTTASASSSIPTGISQSCSSFLTRLNSDTSIKACTAPLLSATEYYTNATSGTSSKSAASTVLSESLSRLCGANTGCNSELIKPYLSDFWSSCMTEIKAKQEKVLALYDVLYLLNPFREAICSQDDHGNYCLTSVASTTSRRRGLEDGLEDEDEEEESDELADSLVSRQTPDVAGAANDTASVPNIAFLFLQPTAGKDKLCSTCAQNILASYIQFETATPYAIGLSNSEVLSGQSALYKAGKKLCGDKWASKVNSIAGTTDFAKVAAAGIGARASTAFVVLGAGAAGLLLAL
ncbi:unnamed protein product [Parajaminaea phylloscopi]